MARKAKESHKSLKLSDIKRDPRLQMREALDQDHIEQLAEVVRGGADLNGEATVFYDGTDYWLADGYHSWEAYDSAGRVAMPCHIIPGAFRDAQRFALSANSKHGKKRQYGDIKRAVSTALIDPEWGRLSFGAVADLCGTNTKHVSRIAVELSNSGVTLSHVNAAPDHLTDEQKDKWNKILAAGGKPKYARDGKVYDTHRDKSPPPILVPSSKQENMDADQMPQERAVVHQADEPLVEDVSTFIKANPHFTDSEVAKFFELTGAKVEQIRSDMLRADIEAEDEQRRRNAATPVSEMALLDPGSEEPAQPDEDEEELHAGMADSGLVDEKNRAIPEQMAEVFTNAASLREARRKISTGRNIINSLIGQAGMNHFSGSYSLSNFVAKLDDMLSAMKSYTPYVVCPACNGDLIKWDHCPTCGDRKHGGKNPTGFVPELQYPTLTQDARNACEEFLHQDTEARAA